MEVYINDVLAYQILEGLATAQVPLEDGFHQVIISEEVNLCVRDRLYTPPPPLCSPCRSPAVCV